MTSVPQLIETVIETAPEGAAFGARHFLHLGSRAALDQALARLTREGRLLRVARGVYVRPVEGKFGVRPPAPERVVETFAALKGEVVATGGAAAANVMGLTTQLPIRQVYLTSGPSRELRLGEQVIELRHAPAWQLALGERPAGTALRALAWLGPKHSRKAMRELRRRLPKVERQAMANVGGRLPTWAAKRVSALAHG